jgi:hypothetical protein
VEQLGLADRFKCSDSTDPGKTYKKQTFMPVPSRTISSVRNATWPIHKARMTL